MKKKLLITLSVVACALLLVVGSIAGTIAYLTSTASVSNTFTVGKVEITMDETDVDFYGVKDGDTRVTANEYKLIPGHSYTKDPIIHVNSDSEDCWLFVKVEDDLAAIQNTKTIAEQMTANGWTQLTTGSNIWWHAIVDVDAENADLDIEVFESFEILSTAVVSDYVNDTTTSTINVTAYAIQADGFDTAAEAWAAAPSDWTATN